MDIQALLAFAGAFLVFAASPGPDNMTIVARTVSHGPLSGLAYGTGMVAGILVFLALTSTGLSVLASEMSWLMTIMRYGGAAYLLWMAFSLWTAPAALSEVTAGSGRGELGRTFLTGIVLNLGNPKMPLFYLALLPNFVGPEFTAGDFVALGSVIVAVETLVIATHISLAGRTRRILRRPVVVRRANRAAAIILFGSGVAVLASGTSR